MIASVKAKDKDSTRCVPKQPCPCGAVTYTLVNGDGNIFSVDKQSGKVKLKKIPEYSHYKLTIGASNVVDSRFSTEKKDMARVNIHIKADALITTVYDYNHEHHLARRSVVRFLSPYQKRPFNVFSDSVTFSLRPYYLQAGNSAYFEIGMCGLGFYL